MSRVAKSLVQGALERAEIESRWQAIKSRILEMPDAEQLRVAADLMDHGLTEVAVGIAQGVVARSEVRR